MGKTRKKPADATHPKIANQTDIEKSAMEKRLRHVFEMDVSKTFAKTLAGVNKNTITKYWKKFEDEILAEKKRDVFTEEELTVSRGLLAIDNLIYDANLQLNEVNKKIAMFEGFEKSEDFANLINKYASTGYFLENKRESIRHFLLQAIDIKVKNELSPSTKSAVEEKMKELMEKNKYGVAGKTA